MGLRFFASTAFNISFSLGRSCSVWNWLMRSRPFETRSLPSSLAATERGFAFYVAFPKSSIRPIGLPIYVARVPAAPFARCPTRSLLPSQLTLITRTTSCSRQLPSCPAAAGSLPPKAPFPASRRVLCLPRRSVGEGGSLIPFAPLCRASSRRAQPLNREGRDQRRQRLRESPIVFWQ